MPRLTIPFYPPTSHGTSLLTPGAAPPAHGVSSPTAVVPLNSELARPPRFTFAPPGANVPADPVVSAAGPSPTSGRKRDKDKSKVRIDKASQFVAEGSGSRTRSNSWSVVSSVFRRKSGSWIFSDCRVRGVKLTINAILACWTCRTALRARHSYLQIDHGSQIVTGETSPNGLIAQAMTLGVSSQPHVGFPEPCSPANRRARPCGR